MKRFLALFLLIATILTMTACQTTPVISSTTQTAENTTAGTAETNEETKPATKYYPNIKTKLTWDQINAIPVASSEMTVAQLRQICMDYFRLQLSFQWTPDEEINYTIANSGKKVSLPTGKVYAGLLYVTDATANLYSLMSYYDSETGILRVSDVGSRNIAQVIGNQCSFGSFWGWARAINSSTHTYTNTINYSHGCLPVGPYTYDTSIKTWGAPNVTTKEVCQSNGQQIIFQSYAAAKPADGLVTYNTAGHVRMISNVHVEYKTNGEIDGDKSYLNYLDQDSGFTSKVLPDGSKADVQGGLDSKVTFAKLFSSSYLPFTFAEFLETDPVEPAEATLSCTDFNGDYQTLYAASVSCNYAISDIVVTVYDAEGKEVYQRVAHNTEPNTKNYTMSKVLTLSVKNLAAKAGNTIKLECRAGNSTLIPLYQGVLTQS